jgi:AcrR family transcriptional regulator
MSQPVAAPHPADVSRSLLPRPDAVLVDRTLTKPERRRRYTRYRLSAAAVDLFQQKGYANTTVAEIADAADMSERTFFRFYPGKEDVIFYDYPEMIEALGERILSIDSPDIWRTIRDLFEATAESFRAPAEFQLARVRLFHAEPVLMNRFLMINLDLEDTLAEFIASRREPGPASYCYSRLAASIIVSTTRTAFRMLAREGGTLADHLPPALDILETQVLQRGFLD